MAFGFNDKGLVNLVRNVLADGKVIIVDGEGVPSWEGYLDSEAFKWDKAAGAVSLIPTRGFRKLVKARAVSGPFVARVYMFNGARFDKDGIPVEGVRVDMFPGGTTLVGEWVDGENVGFGLYIGFR